MHDTGPLGVQELSSSFVRLDVDASGDHRSGATLLGGHQSFRQVHDEGIHCQRFQRSAKGFLDGLRQPPVHRHRLAHERERMRPSAEHPYRLGEKRWRHIDDPISETLAGARASIVDLIRKQHDHLPGNARPSRAPVVEHLDAGVGHANGIRVVAMLLVGLAGEPRPE